MSKDINKDEDLELQKQVRGLDGRIKKLEKDVGELADTAKETNKILKEMLEIIRFSAASTLGDKEAAQKLKELVKRND